MQRSLKIVLIVIDKVFLIGMSNLFKIILGFCLLKFSTSFLTTEEFGRLGHFMTFISLLFIFSGGGLSNGIIALVGQSKDNKILLKKLELNFIFLTLIFTLFISLCLFFFSDSISKALFRDEEYSFFIKFCSLSVFFFGLTNFTTSFLNGLLKTKEYVVIQVLGSIIAIFIGYFFIRNYGFQGAILAYIFQFLALLIPAAIYFKKFFKLRISYQSIDIEILIKAFKFSMIAIVGIFSVPLTEFFIRELIIQNLSYESAAHWQSLNRIAVALTSFFIAFFTFYLLPNLSLKFKENIDLYKKIILKVFPFFILIIFFVVLFGDYLVKILLTEDYLVITNYFILQFTGDLFKLLSYLFLFYAIACGALKIILVFEFLQFSLLYGLTKINLLMDLELLSVYESYSIAYVIYFFLVGVWAYRELVK